VVGDVANLDAGLFVHLAAHRLLEALARLQEACKTRVES
jgi:hypothetical protein